jgi:hypothetical protein
MRKKHLHAMSVDKQEEALVAVEDFNWGLQNEESI